MHARMHYRAEEALTGDLLADFLVGATAAKAAFTGNVACIKLLPAARRLCVKPLLVPGQQLLRLADLNQSSRGLSISALPDNPNERTAASSCRNLDYPDVSRSTSDVNCTQMPGPLHGEPGMPRRQLHHNLPRGLLHHKQ